jgi:hypothetical protein
MVSASVIVAVPLNVCAHAEAQHAKPSQLCLPGIEFGCRRYNRAAGRGMAFAWPGAPRPERNALAGRWVDTVVGPGSLPAAFGSNEQFSGVNEQIPGTGQSDSVSVKASFCDGYHIVEAEHAIGTRCIEAVDMFHMRTREHR